MRRTVFPRLTAFALAVSILFCTVLGAIQFTVSAEEGVVDYSKTNVLDDLQSATANGKPFDITDYPYRIGVDMQVIQFVEYCYSYRENMQKDYGLYIYVYNPSGETILDSPQNKIQMAVSYDADGRPSDYVKFNLQLCNFSEGNYKNLFYKFKVIEKPVNETTFLDRVNTNARRYDVSGVELVTKSLGTATEYHVGGTYLFTGYAQGYGPDSEAPSTLTCNIEYLESIELSVKHTFYRSKTSSLGAGHQNQLDTVYFSLPKRYLEEYGMLQKIKAEWYEYKTREIVVTSNLDFYTGVIPYVGMYMGDLNEYGMYEHVDYIDYSLGIDAGKVGDMYVAKWGWNLGTGYFHPACQRLCYLFYTGNLQEYDPYADIVSQGGVKSNALYEWIKNYDRSFDGGRLPIKNGTVSADLFCEDIDEIRKMNNENGVIQKGYSYYDFDVDVDLQILKSWSDTSPSFWDNWLEFGLGEAFRGGPDEESVIAPPIQILKESDLAGTNEEIAKRLLVNVADVNAIKAEYTDAVTISGINDEEKVVVLFRFATSDYYSEAVDIIELDSGFLWSDKHTKGQAYIAQESVFFDFDIIQLTFNKDGEYAVIPVVSNPITIVDDVTPPTNIPKEEVQWWRIVLSFVLVVLLLVLLFPVLPYILNGIVWFIMLPIKAIKVIRNHRNEKRKEDYKEFNDHYKEE